MKNFKVSVRRGFTMIELLIVIAVLGILAVAVISAINPIEQIDRSKDTGSRSDAEQLIGGVDRYYTTKGFYPWQSSTDDPSSVAWSNTKDYVDGFLNNLSNSTAELKASFVSRITAGSYNTLWIYNRGQAGDSTYVCFMPQSKAFSDEAVSRCTNGMPDDIDATTNSTICGGTDNTYSCLP